MCLGQLAAPTCHFCAAGRAGCPVGALVQLPRCCPGAARGFRNGREAAIGGEEKAVPAQLSMTTRSAGEALAEPGRTLAQSVSLLGFLREF